MMYLRALKVILASTENKPLDVVKSLHHHKPLVFRFFQVIFKLHLNKLLLCRIPIPKLPCCGSWRVENVETLAVWHVTVLYCAQKTLPTSQNRGHNWDLLPHCVLAI